MFISFTIFSILWSFFHITAFHMCRTLGIRVGDIINENESNQSTDQPKKSPELNRAGIFVDLPPGPKVLPHN